MSENTNTEKPKGLTGNGCLTIFLAFLIVFAGFGIYCIASVGSFMSQTKKSSIKNYCYDARLSSYEPYVERADFAYYNGYRQSSGSSYKALESKKYKDELKMRKALPESYTEALKAAVNDGRHEESVDLDGKPVTRYYVPESMLPLDAGTSSTQVVRFYFVYKYSDGSYRFAILVQVTDPDY